MKAAEVTGTPRTGGATTPGADRGSRLASELARQRHVAVELQHAILPLHHEPFDLPGLQAFVKYLPASSADRVGGDWYITAEMPDDRVLIAIGDVAGHGLAAAAGMARLRGALAGLAFTGSPPGRLVGWLNDLVRHVAPEHTASVITGFYHPQARQLTWAQAGHPPPLLIRGAFARLLDPPEGILLGAGQSGYAAATLQLQAGDQLLLYSDGLIERRGEPIDSGISRLLRAARAAGRPGDPERLASGVLSALAPADGEYESEDDTCLVALRVL
jgi:serine phosphatase RsbU (regulator of sigma subunit)